MNLEMVPVEIVGLKVNMQAVIHTSRQLGCMHIEELTDVPEVSARPLTLDRDTLRLHEQLSFLVARLGGLLDALGGIHQKPIISSSGNYRIKARPGVEKLMPKVKSLTSQRERLESELASLPRYQATLRKTDVVARVGCDEFAVLLPETDADAVHTVVSKAFKNLSDGMDENRYPVSFSAGIVTFHQASLSVDAALDLADLTMYEVKTSRKNNITYETHT